MRNLMKRLSKILNLVFLSTGFFLSSCSSQEMNPYAFFEPFSQYRTDDGVLTFNVQFSDKSGKGMVKLNNENLNFVWSRYKPNYGICLDLENGERIFLELHSIKKNDGTYSQEKILATAVDIADIEVKTDFIGWSSSISKEKELSDEEIDVNKFVFVGFRNSNTLYLFFKYSEKEEAYVSGGYLLSFGDEKSFLISRKGHQEETRGHYEVSRKFLYLDFKEDELFDMKGRNIPFFLEEVL